MQKTFQKTSLKPILILDLLEALDDEQVLYCHWKSNWRIDRWLEGDGDLDLLVSRKDVGKFTAVLNNLGFKKAIPPADKDVPGILNFYGYDEQSQQFIHVHAHYQLVLGHDFTKSYRLPVEDAFLSDAIPHEEIYIASPEMELIFLAIRMVLKYSTAESFGRFLLGKLKNHRREISSEICYLELQINEVRLNSILRKYFPMIGEELFQDCLNSLREEAGIWQKVSVKRKLVKRLTAYLRMPRYLEVSTRYWRSFAKIIQKVFKMGMKRKKLENGGVLIAIIGGDGAGKTTAVNDIYGWLSKKFDTKRVHLGKPAKSVSTLISGIGLKVSNKLFKTDKSEEPNSKSSFFQQLRWACTARDRYKLYKQIRRYLGNGEIVICDRYPIPDLHLMDSPKIEKSVGKENLTGYSKFLGDLENWYYSQLMPPDEMFVLRVEPETAVSRKTDEPATHVFTRSTELWNFNWQQTDVQLIDASRPLEEVQADLRSRIWKAI